MGLIAQQDGYQKQDLRSNRKQWTQTTGYAVCQPNGQPLALFNPQGKRTWRKAPNSLWGLPLLSSWERKQAEPLNPNLLFAGQYTDDESGLAYNRFRYYDPSSGTYLTSDPIGLAGGETPYRYPSNSLRFIDPLGLTSYTPPASKGNPLSRGNNPYQTRIDPSVPGRPDPRYSIDTSTFSSGVPTMNGGIRNNKEFWNEWTKLNPNSISSTNKFRIEKLGLSKD